jgi:hypothetical protein
VRNMLSCKSAASHYPAAGTSVMYAPLLSSVRAR